VVVLSIAFPLLAIQSWALFFRAYGFLINPVFLHRKTQNGCTYHLVLALFPQLPPFKYFVRGVVYFFSPISLFSNWWLLLSRTSPSFSPWSTLNFSVWYMKFFFFAIPKPCLNPFLVVLLYLFYLVFPTVSLLFLLYFFSHTSDVFIIAIVFFTMPIRLFNLP